MTANATMRATQITMGYPGRIVGSHLSLAVYGHEVLCLLGPNGSGKSTLFKTLLGLIPTLSGTVYVKDKAVAQWSRSELARQVAYVPQAHAGMFPFTVHDIVLMGRNARLGRFASPSHEDSTVVMQCLDQLGIAHLAQRIYTEISGGERQLTLIARALAQEPAIMVMDEPTASLDFGNQIMVLECIRSMRGLGMGILLCTHQPEHALRVADRVALLKQGQIHHAGPTLSTATIGNLAWLYDLDPGVVAANLPALAGQGASA